MRRALAKWRWAGLGVIWDAADPDDAPQLATAEITTQTVSLTVVYVQAPRTAPRWRPRRLAERRRA